MPASIRLTAPAKLTLSLRITGVRADGYHLLDAEMVSIDLCDVITITPSDTTSIEVTGPYVDGVPTGGSNLVAGALDLVGRTARVTIDKQIPHGGGLGGGSTDAAAIVRWAGFDDLEAAAALGADIAFCVAGGRARVRGIGERVEPLVHEARDLTLVIPPLRVSTPAAYRAFDHLDGVDATAVNQLEAAAIAVEPELARWRRRIAELAGTTPVLAGSGATWFVHGKHGNALAELADEGAHVREVHTIRGSKTDLGG